MSAIDAERRTNNERRIARMNVWIDLAEKTPGADKRPHVRFVFYWIAYEAAHQTYRTKRQGTGGQERHNFHKKLARRDRGRLQRILLSRTADVARILELRQASPFFWYEQGTSVRNPEDWERKFKKRVQNATKQLEGAISGRSHEGEGHRRTAAVLDDLFENLNLVRNQIAHGGSAGHGGWGKTQVVRGARLLGDFIPCFRDSIELNINQDWGHPPFPRVGTEPDDPNCTPRWLQ